MVSFGVTKHQQNSNETTRLYTDSAGELMNKIKPVYYARMILDMGLANEKRRYIVQIASCLAYPMP